MECETSNEEPGTPSDGSVQKIDDSSKRTARLAQLYNNQKFSDVILCVAHRRYHAHKLLLASASDVFEQMLTSPNWVDSRHTELVLQEESSCMEQFGHFVKYLYTGQVSLTPDGVLGLLVLADKYNVGDLKQCCSEYMIDHLVSTATDNKAVVWYQYAIACNSVSLQEACFEYITLNADVVLQSPDWPCIDADNLIVLLQRSDLVVCSEYVLLQGVVRWLRDERREGATEHMERLLHYVRFPMVLPEQLFEFESSEFAMAHRDYLLPHLLVAYRYHALASRGADSGADAASLAPATQYVYRNYTDDRYAVGVDVIRGGYNGCPRVSSRVERPLNVPRHVGMPSADKLCKLKVTFYPLGFYTTSLWNGQLSIARATDQTRLVVSHRGGHELREAEVSAVVFARRNGIQYVRHAITETHVFEPYGSFEIDDVIPLYAIKNEMLAFIVAGALHLKVFVRPVNFYPFDG